MLLNHLVGPLVLLLSWLMIGSAEGQEDKPISLGIVVFEGFQPLDVWGPLDIFYSLTFFKNISLAIIAHEIGPITAKSPPRRNPPILQPGMIRGPTMAPAIVATHTFESAPQLDILLVPGGGGNRVLAENNDTSVEDFVAARYAELQYLLSVCTGAVSLAKSGLLEGRKATSNKAAWAWVITHGKNVTWVPSARWVVDGNIWTSSGVAAGMDMTYAFLKHYFGPDDPAVDTTLVRVEYAPHTNPDWDPFSIVHNKIVYALLDTDRSGVSRGVRS